MSKPITNCAVVLIDDNEVDLYLHERLISHAGLFSSVSVYKAPEPALDYLASLPFSEPEARSPIVILLDIKMPETDGFWFVSHFEVLPASVRNRCHIVMLSATLHLSDTLRAQANPSISAFVDKPLTIKTLKELAGMVA
jgi:CheY-like chemotaxis protein